ncbi:MAG: hydrogenase formation protein HypD [Cyanobium sp.]
MVAGACRQGLDAEQKASEVQASEVKELAARLAALTTRPWTLMEVCGGQTHAIVRWGLDQLLPPGMRLVHGPGCPVCVTPAATIERALELARRPEVILCSYGDMLRVPGSSSRDLLSVRAAGGDVRLLTSPLQALALARAHPERQVVFLAVGFETTAPATALLAEQALALGVDNLSLLCAHVRVPPAMEVILADPDGAVQGFLAAGHVCAVQGTAELQQLVARWRVPVVVSGFEPVELLEAGRPALRNAYGQVVRAEGNTAAQARLQRVFRVVDRPWRGFGLIEGGGLALAEPYRELDAERRFAPAIPCQPSAGRRSGRDMAAPIPSCGQGAGTSDGRQPPGPATWERQGESAWQPPGPSAELPPRQWNGSGDAPARDPLPEGMAPPQALSPPRGGHRIPRPGALDPEAASPGSRAAAGGGDPGEHAGTICIAGAILRGRACPGDCGAFAAACTPEHPLGAPMVSSEGACAAWYRYRDRR